MSNNRQGVLDRLPSDPLLGLVMAILASYMATVIAEIKASPAPFATAYLTSLESNSLFLLSNLGFAIVLALYVKKVVLVRRINRTEWPRTCAIVAGIPSGAAKGVVIDRLRSVLPYLVITQSLTHPTQLDRFELRAPDLSTLVNRAPVEQLVLFFEAGRFVSYRHAYSTVSQGADLAGGLVDSNMLLGTAPAASQGPTRSTSGRRGRYARRRSTGVTGETHPDPPPTPPARAPRPPGAPG